jgi:hypothetical protein
MIISWHLGEPGVVLLVSLSFSNTWLTRMRSENFCTIPRRLIKQLQRWLKRLSPSYSENGQSDRPASTTMSFHRCVHGSIAAA